MEDLLVRKLAETYFPDEFEMMPDGSFEELSKGGDVDVISISGANQIDIGAAIGVIKLLFDLVKFVRSILKDRVDAEKTRQKIKDKLQKKYSVLIADFSDDEIDEFIRDLVNV